MNCKIFGVLDLEMCVLSIHGTDKEKLTKKLLAKGLANILDRATSTFSHIMIRYEMLF